MLTLRDRESYTPPESSRNRVAVAGIGILSACCIGIGLSGCNGENRDKEDITPGSLESLPDLSEGHLTNEDSGLTSLPSSSPPTLADKTVSLPPISQIDDKGFLEQYPELVRTFDDLVKKYPTLNLERDILKDQIDDWVEQIGDVSDIDKSLHCELEMARLKSNGAFDGLSDKENHFHYWALQFPMRFTNEEARQLSKITPDPLPPLEEIVSILGQERIVEELSPDQLFDILDLFNLEQFRECFGSETLALLEEHDRERFYSQIGKENK